MSYVLIVFITIFKHNPREDIQFQIIWSPRIPVTQLNFFLFPDTYQKGKLQRICIYGYWWGIE